MTLALERPLAFFDLETTGIKIGKDRIVQIGIVRLNADGSRTSYQTLVNPGIPIPAEATAIHGITDLNVAMAPTLDAVADDILQNLAGCDLAGFNVLGFDIGLLASELDRVGKTWDYSGSRVVDVKNIYHKLEPRNLSAAVKYYCGREHTGAHDALADSEATADILLAQLIQRSDVLQGTVDFLGEFCEDRKRLSPDFAGKLKYDETGNVCVGFGKYSGWPLERIGQSDPGYLDWFFNKSDFPANTKEVARRALERSA